MKSICYDDYQNLIHKLSWSWARSINMDQEDLFSEGNLVFCTILNNWDKNKGSFSTFLTSSINNRFKMLNKKRRESLMGNSRGIENICDDSQDKSMEFWSEIGALSSEAKEVVNIVLSGPSDICQLGSLKDHLREAGWAWVTIRESIREIKSIFH